ncbi:MAG: ABC transporter ATP-binding protein [Limosilactobacillus sp.]|uniref:ABC transporter ATP-binding protein n=1 Tax=Limosilactobacillus sp. TaxID=2773925 RepID=UPI0023D5CC12|nr:ABC transporter ATP-binding protein [Limosilactobacillus sp.]MDE7039432.1 ABC transporter ATP-binding protein [Limosilactobacillus sp.]
MEKRIIEVSNISKSFKNKILDNISFSLSQGEVVSLTGLNGAGKTTLIKIILGLLKPNAGRIKLNVTPKQDIGVILQDVSLPDDMKVIEWLTLISKFSKYSDSDLDLILQKVNLQKYKNSLCNTLSGGNKRKLQFAVSIVNNPKLLILDEPTTGLDYKAKREFWDLLKNMVKKRSLTVLVITHDLDEVENFTDRLLIINNKKLIADTNVKTLMETLKQKGKIFVDNQHLSELILNDNLKVQKVDDRYCIYTNNIDETVSELLSKGISYKHLKIQPNQLSDFFESEVESNNV